LLIYQARDIPALFAHWARIIGPTRFSDISEAFHKTIRKKRYMTADLTFYALQKIGGHMKVLTVIIVLIALYGCVNGHFFSKGYNQELACKCDIDPYNPDCLQPPPVFHN
jgi:hypothetical protein